MCLECFVKLNEEKINLENFDLLILKTTTMEEKNEKLMKDPISEEKIEKLMKDPTMIQLYPNEQQRLAEVARIIVKQNEKK